MGFLDLLNHRLSDGRWGVAQVTYSHLGGNSVFMKLEDILKTKQLPLTFFVVLDALEIPKSATNLVTVVGGEADILT